MQILHDPKPPSYVTLLDCPVAKGPGRQGYSYQPEYSRNFGTTSHFVRLSTGQRPRQTRTILSARIFQELRDHFPVAKGKDQVDSSLHTKALE